MYLEGLRNEGILVSTDSIPDSVSQQKTEFGKPQQQGPQNVDLNRVSQRTVSLHSVNWGPPE